MSLKLNKFLLDFGENKALFMKKLVPLGNTKLAFLWPLIRSIGYDIVLIIAFVGFRSEK